MDIKKLRIMTRMTQKAFADYFNIPVRTLQDWEAEKRTPPPYVAELIKYKIEKERLGMLRLVEKDHGEEKVLMEGILEEIIEYLKENEEIYNWVLDEDPTAEMPCFDGVEGRRDLECELAKVDLSWWSLEVREIA
ncbi:MAG TPA: helix-turn-helix domain-containing protein [Clostridiales bacterium]|nr:helix-turn-helix domain-containing protein [Clostridiales bacterium]